MNKLRISIPVALLVMIAGSVVCVDGLAGESGAHGNGKGYGKGHGKCEGEGQGKGMCGNMPSHADFDLDSDGKITEWEFNEAHAQRMSEIAAQGRNMKHADHAPSFADIDTNGDAGISPEEFSAHQVQHHEEMQKHKNQAHEYQPGSESASAEQD